MTRKIADDFEALNAGLKRLEAEKQRALSGDPEPHDLPPVEAYEGSVNYDDPNCVGHQSALPPWGQGPFGGAQSGQSPPQPNPKPLVGELRPIGHGQFLVWSGKAWVSEEEWQDKGIQV